MRTIYSHSLIMVLTSISLIGMGESQTTSAFNNDQPNMQIIQLLSEISEYEDIAYVEVDDHTVYNVTLYWLEEVVLSTTCKEEAIVYMAQVNDQWRIASIETRINVLTGNY